MTNLWAFFPRRWRFHLLSRYTVSAQRQRGAGKSGDGTVMSRGVLFPSSKSGADPISVDLIA